MREMLKEIARTRQQETGVVSFTADDYMDDGTRISLNIVIDQSQVIISLLANSVRWNHGTFSSC